MAFMIDFIFLFPLCAGGEFVSGAVNGLQCLKPFSAFLRCECGPRLAAKQYMLRLSFCCCSARNMRGNPLGLPASPTVPEMDGEMLAPAMGAAALVPLVTRWCPSCCQ